MKIILSPGEIESFCKKWKITELSVFGSALREDFSDQSDVDFLVLFSEDASWTLLDLDDIQSDLEHIVGRKVDLVTKKGIESSRNGLRRENILSTARVVYESVA